MLMSPGQALKEKDCDMPDTLIVASTESVIHVPVYNSGSLPVLVKKGLTIGSLEEVTVVERDDSLWLDDESETVRVCQVSKQNRCKELTKQLQKGRTVARGRYFKFKSYFVSTMLCLLWMTVS